MTGQRYWLTVVAPLLLALPASANPLVPGQGGTTPDVFPVSSGVTLLGNTGSLPFSFDGGATTGTFIETVGTDTSNVVCPGCLDFAFDFSVTDSTNSIIFADIAGFSGFITDAGWSNFIPGGVAPPSMNESFPGAIVFSFTAAPV